MKFSTIVALTVLGVMTTVLVTTPVLPAPPPDNDQCWNAIPITCPSNLDGDPNVYFGNSTDATHPAFSDGGNNLGVWYKLSTGGNTFKVRLDTCFDANYDSYISVYTGPCTALNHTNSLACVAGDNNGLSCLWTCMVGPLSASGDEDYWVFVHGHTSLGHLGGGDFNLTVTCDPVIRPPFHGAPLGNIDPWYIQRSAYPPPDVTNIDPLKGGTWVEVHRARVEDGDIPVGGHPLPRLEATAHALPPEGQRCDQGTLIPGATFTATPYDPDVIPAPGEPPCPELMNGPDSYAVLQEFTIPDPYSKGIWITPIPGSNDGQFQFCVHTSFQLDYDETDRDIEEVSYLDTYYVVEVDYTTNFIQQVAALDRNPGNIDTIFDDWLVEPYLCADGNVPHIPINTRTPTDEARDYFVGENFRVCITPKPGFETFIVDSLINVTCSNTNSNANNNRALIVLGNIPEEEEGMTVIDNSTLTRPTNRNTEPRNGIAFESTVTSGFIDPDLRMQYFDCVGTVEMEHINRRILQDAGDVSLLPYDENFTGSFKVKLRIVNPEPELKSHPRVSTRESLRGSKIK